MHIRAYSARMNLQSCGHLWVICCTVYGETCILCTNPLTPRTTEGDMDANTVAINFVWTLVAGFLVMFMQAGFALVETGFTRAKNAAATIPTGALAEQWRFVAFAVFSVFVGAVIYPIYANWTWGGGWLAMLGKNLGLGHGHVDFAGSSVVHMTGGVMAFVTAILLGPRRGKYNANGTVNAIPGHNIPMALVGTFILAFGWFGFNAGSTLAGSDLRIGGIATNTMLAGAAGGITAMLYVWGKYGKPPPPMPSDRAPPPPVARTPPRALLAAPNPARA